MKILGISSYYHDSAAALIDNGQLVASAEEERFSRIKHDRSFPHRAIDFCLESGGVAGRDVDYVVFYEKPFLKFERLFLSMLQTYPRSRRLFREQISPWLFDKLWVRSELARRLDIPQKKVLFAEHHISHAASAFFCSPFEDAAILTTDGVGEWATASMGYGSSAHAGQAAQLCLTHEMKFPHSLGLLYSAFTAFLGFEVNEGEYKVMGMAAYGQPRYVEKVCRVADILPDGSINLDLSYLAYPYDTERSYSAKFERLFGPARTPGAPFQLEVKNKGSTLEAELVRQSLYYADVAASIQRVTEDIVVAMARHLRRSTGQRNLCLAGGVALNGMANYRLLREAGFDQIYIHPAPGDSGGAIGAALYADHVLLGQPRRFVMDHVFWGKGYDSDSIRRYLDGAGIAYTHFSDETALLERIVDCLEKGQVVGWHQGRFEWGPRALGNRSILADPRRAEMKAVVNSKVKYREPFRPFAPSLPASQVAKYFDLTPVENIYPLRFMQLVVPVKDEKRGELPATTHADGTSRLQAVFPETNARYHRLLKIFGQATGTPVLLNTSFNIKGEPIVASPEDSFRCFSHSGMESLVIGDYLIEKSRVWCARNIPA